MSAIVTYKPTTTDAISARTMKIGELGFVHVSAFRAEGEIVLRGYCSLMSLSNPGNTWNFSDGFHDDCQVIPLPAGTKIEFTSEA